MSYAKVAVDAAKTAGNGTHPRTSWYQALTSNNKSSDKDCPRTAFLGLCEIGYIKNVQPIRGLVGSGAVNNIRAVDVRGHIMNTLLPTNKPVTKQSLSQFWVSKNYSCDNNAKEVIEVILALHNNSLLL